MSNNQHIPGRRSSFATITLLIGASLAASAAVAGTPSRAAQQGNYDFCLTVLHNNDGESQLINAGSGLEDFGGAARFTTVVKHIKREATQGRDETRFGGGCKRGVVMLSSGDNFLAGPEFNASLDKGVPYYDTIAMDLIGYDAVDIGNHDFDFGSDVLADFIEGYNTPVPYLSSNLDFSGEPRLDTLVAGGRIAGSTIITERGERIGIVGATTENLSFISSPRNVIVNAVAPAVQAEIDALTEQGVDKIILISHLQNVAEDQALAPLLTGVDIMIAGGGDELLANADDLLLPGDTPAAPYPLWATGADGAEIPVVTTAGEYRYVGELVVGFDKDGNVVTIDEDSSGPVRVAGGANPDAVEPDAAVDQLVTQPVKAYIDGLSNTIIGTSEVDLDGLRSSVRTKETNEGNLIADALLWLATQRAADYGVPVPDVALQNGGGIRNNTVIAAGPVSELDTFDMVPFPNFVVVVPGIPRDQFKDIMENAVSKVEFTNGRFAQIAGFTMAYDPSGTPMEIDGDGNVTQAGDRVEELILDDGTVIVTGGSVVAGPAINVATIDFLVKGGDQYPYGGAAFTAMGATYQQALSAYIQDALGGVISAADYPEGGEGRITP